MSIACWRQLPDYLYALRILRNHGTPIQTLHDVFRATVVAKMTYCAPTSSGSYTATYQSWTDSFFLSRDAMR